MGVKQGIFYTDDGDVVAVSFYGEKVETGDIRLASSPVIIQMDGGGGDYTPVKYATASISCKTTGVELFDLCVRDPLDVAVEVYNRTTSTVIFAGYISPNTYSQPIDGVNETLTLECVDWLGAAKLIQYQRTAEEYSVMTLREAVLRVCSLLKADATVSMADFVKISDENNSTTLYPELSLAESIFFESPSKPKELQDGTFSVAPNAKTCHDILAMIAESFRATWLQIGDKIMLVDTLRSHAFYKLSKSAVVTPSTGPQQQRHIDARAIRQSGSTLSVLPRYTQFTVTRSPANAVLMPSPLEREALTPRGERINDKIVSEPNAPLVRTRLAQLLTPRDIAIDVDGVDVSFNTPSSSDTPSAVVFGAKTIDGYLNDSLDQWGEGWDNYIRVFCPKRALDSEKSVLAVKFRTPYISPSVEGEMYALRIVAEIGVATTTEGASSSQIKEEENELANEWFPEHLLRENREIAFEAVVKCGDFSLSESDGLARWADGDNVINLVATGSGQWRKTVTVLTPANISRVYEDNRICYGTKNGVVDVALRFVSDFNRTNVILVKHFSVELVPASDVLKALFDTPVPDSVRAGSYEYAKALDAVEPPITFGFPLTSKTFSSVIAGRDYASVVNSGGKKRTVGKLVFFDTEGDYSFIERVQRLANMGDGREFTFNLKDPHNVISPLDTFTSALWLGDKVCVAYQRDVEKNNINITLN